MVANKIYPGRKVLVTPKGRAPSYVVTLVDTNTNVGGWTCMKADGTLGIIWLSGPRPYKTQVL